MSSIALNFLPKNQSVWIACHPFIIISLEILFAENEDDSLNDDNEQESSIIINECKKDASISKRRPSLAQKMTSNLRRLSGAADLKIDINDPIAVNNPNKKIKVSKTEDKNTHITYTCVKSNIFMSMNTMILKSADLFGK